jgi:3-hydroxybutyryl-CoA dehydrogenase
MARRSVSNDAVAVNEAKQAGFQSRNVAIIGAGTMGTDVAAIFAASGWDVHAAEPQAARWDGARSRMEQSIAQLGKQADATRISLYETLAELPWNAISIAVECAPEKLELKQQLFQEMDRRTPAGIPLASNSSSFPISEIARGCATGTRMLGLHFFMPAHLVPAVEVIRGEGTDPAVWQRCAMLMRALGKVPVLVKKDIPGFLANRLQHALAREAFALIDAGLASPQDVDNAVRYGFGLRFLAAGPVLQKDIAGLDIHCAAASTMYPDLARDTIPARTLRDKVQAGKLGMKTGEGFYQWTPASAAKEKARYEKVLLQALAILKDSTAS